MTTKERQRLDLLLRENSEARDDERYLFAQYAVIIGAAVLIIIAMASVFYTTCPSDELGHCRPTSKKVKPEYDQAKDSFAQISSWKYIPLRAREGNLASDDKLTPISVWLYIGAPLLPIALIA